MVLDDTPVVCPRTAVSVIVACRNEAGEIRAFLDSLAEQERAGIEMEAVIADGMSDDGTFEILQEFSRRHPFIRVVRNPGRIVATGLNQAIRISRGEIIIRMDAHTAYAPDYVRECVRALRRTGADNVGGPARTRADGFMACAIAIAYRSSFASGGAKFHREDHEGYVDTVPYGCWKREIFERLGYFDESLVRNQDDEFNLRIVRSGGRIWQSPRIVSWYRPRSRLSRLFRQYFQYGYWKVRVIRKHRLPASWRQLVPAGFVIANLLLLALGGIGRAVNSPWTGTVLACWAAMAASYISLSMIAAFTASRKHDWAILSVLPLVFMTYHVAYGSGFLLGLLSPRHVHTTDTGTSPLSEITR